MTQQFTKNTDTSEAIVSVTRLRCLQFGFQQQVATGSQPPLKFHDLQFTQLPWQPVNSAFMLTFHLLSAISFPRHFSHCLFIERAANNGPNHQRAKRCQFQQQWRRLEGCCDAAPPASASPLQLWWVCCQRTGIPRVSQSDALPRQRVNRMQSVTLPSLPRDSASTWPRVLHSTLPVEGERRDWEPLLLSRFLSSEISICST